MKKYALLSSAVFSSSELKFYAQPNSSGEILYKLRKTIKPDEKILTFSQSLVGYYATANFISKFDPIMAKVYNSKTPLQAFKQLLKLKVNYIFTPNIASPVYYNSIIAKICADPVYTQIIMQNESATLYKIYKKPKVIKKTVVWKYPSKNISSVELWHTVNNHPFFKTYSNFFDENVTPTLKKSNTLFFSNATYPSLYLGSGYAHRPPNNAFDNLVIEPGQYYHATTTLTGNGYAILQLAEYNQQRIIRLLPIGQAILNEGHKKTISSNFLTMPNTKQFRLLVYLKNDGGHLRLLTSELTKINGIVNKGMNALKAFYKAGWTIYGSAMLEIKYKPTHNLVFFKSISQQQGIGSPVYTINRIKYQKYCVSMKIKGRGMLMISLYDKSLLPKYASLRKLMNLKTIPIGSYYLRSRYHDISFCLDRLPFINPEGLLTTQFRFNFNFLNSGEASIKDIKLYPVSNS